MLDKRVSLLYAVLCDAGIKTSGHLNSGKCVCVFGFHLFVKLPFYFCTELKGN